MTFIELTRTVKAPIPNYFELLLTHHEVIIAEVGKTSKTEVSKALGMTASKFSGVFGCIVAYNTLTFKAL